LLTLAFKNMSDGQNPFGQMGRGVRLR
jgi:hypothetical protein